MKKNICLIIGLCFLVQAALFCEVIQVKADHSIYIYTYNALEQAKQDFKTVEIVLKEDAAGKSKTVPCQGTVERTMLFFDPQDNACGYVIIYGTYNGTTDYHYISYNDIAVIKIVDDI